MRRMQRAPPLARLVVGQRQPQPLHRRRRAAPTRARPPPSAQTRPRRSQPVRAAQATRATRRSSPRPGGRAGRSGGTRHDQRAVHPHLAQRRVRHPLTLRALDLDALVVDPPLQPRDRVAPCTSPQAASDRWRPGPSRRRRRRPSRATAAALRSQALGRLHHFILGGTQSSAARVSLFESVEGPMARTGRAGPLPNPITALLEGMGAWGWDWDRVRRAAPGAPTSSHGCARVRGGVHRSRRLRELAQHPTAKHSPRLSARLPGLLSTRNRVDPDRPGSPLITPTPANADRAARTGAVADRDALAAPTETVAPLTTGDHAVVGT